MPQPQLLTDSPASLQDQPYLDHSLILARMDQMIVYHNQVQTHLRDHIRHGPAQTLKNIIFKYIKFVGEVIQATDMADSDRMPMMMSNNWEQARLNYGGKRTVYDHLEKLIAGGFIQKKFRGSTHAYGLWINPWIMFGGSYPLPCVVDLSQAVNPGFDLFIRKSSPHKYTLESSLNLLKGGVNSVDKIIPVVLRGVSPQNSPVATKVDFFSLERAVDRTNLPATESLEGAGGGPGEKSDPKHVLAGKGGDRARNSLDGDQSSLRNSPGSVYTPEPVDKAPTPLEQFQAKLVLNFWETARKKCYLQDKFSEKHTQEILQIVRTDVFFNFTECPNDARSLVLYNARLEQLDKAERYALKENWSSFMAPKKYFSLANFESQKAANLKGNFHHTTAWQLIDEQRRQCADRKRMVNNAVDAVMRNQFPRGYSGDTGPIALYSYYFQRLKKRCSPELLDEFSERVKQHFALLKHPITLQTQEINL